MSGHNKWAQIKHKKGAADQKKGQLFSKLSKNIVLAAMKGLNPQFNIDLERAIQRAREANMPRENIERAITNATRLKS